MSYMLLVIQQMILLLIGPVSAKFLCTSVNSKCDTSQVNVVGGLTQGSHVGVYWYKAAMLAECPSCLHQ